jgi:hypothetical protein
MLRFHYMKMISKNNDSKKILIVSYFSFNETLSMSLWTRDKVNSLINLGFDVHLVTSPIYYKNPNNHLCFPVKTYYVSSINPTSYWNEIKSGEMSSNFLSLIIIYSLGLLHEFFERLILKRIGHGMWGWTIPALLKVIFLSRNNKYDYILSLGGPTSAHLASSVVSIFFRKKVVIEFQDPIVGDDIGHNSRSARLFKYLEKFLVSTPSKIVFVTKSAAKESQMRHPEAKNISCVYTSSSSVSDFQFVSNEIISNKLRVRIAYFGEMYSTRNYYSLILAIEKLNSQNSKLKFQIDHFGRQVKIDYDGLNKNLIFKNRTPIDREKAMREALAYDLLLLIQHTDNRSKLTIPYKTWDYLNLRKPILALLNNDELKLFLDSLGHYTSNVNDIESIVNTILRFIKDNEENRVRIFPNPYEINEQVLELLS